VITPLALTFAFGLQLLRMWIAGLLYYGYEVAHASYATLIGLAVVVFGAAFFAGIVQRKLGARAMAIVASSVALLRLIEQINPVPAIDLGVSSIGVALFLIFISLCIDVLRANDQGRHVATSILLGLSIDTAIKGAFGTIDLSWVPGLLPIAIVVVLVAIQVWWLVGTHSPGGPDAPHEPAQSASLLALGPFFFLQAQLFQNIGYVSTVTNWAPPIAFEFIILANALGLLLASVVYGRLPRRAWTWTFTVGLILIVVTLPLEGDPLAGLEMMAGQAAAAIGLALMMQDAGSTRSFARARTEVVVGISMVLMFLLVIGYYLGHIVRLPLEYWMFAPIAAVIVLIAMVRSVLKFDGPRPADRADWTPAFAGLGLMILPVIALIGWREPIAISGSLPVRIMSYNLHSGFDVAGRLDLEAIAQTIESEQADVIALQEVSRGWLIDGSVDMLAWLSQRSNMPYVWGPTADPFWGNAILSRYPIKDVQLYAMPNNDVVRPRRGFIVATIDLGDQALRVITTHLHHVGEDGELRVPQVQAILAAWANQPATIILGDLNARPEAIEMQMMRDAGLIDSFMAAEQGNDLTFGSNQPDRRIDYIYHTRDLITRDLHVNPSTASDHRGLAVTIAK
jgi:endonuclease/exonuclease/phosphatase family metal-dependent hydrolase